MCENPISSGYCVIDGQCISHNTPQPDNPCRYCDANLQQSAWTNSSGSTSCNDSLWCNGADTCNGAGACIHEYPTSNRCAGVSGACAVTTCDETRDSCFQPNTLACGTSTEQQCSSLSCGGSVQARSVTRYCSGSSALCDGATQTSTWSTTTCSGAQSCNATTYSCQDALGCQTTYCDPTTDKCWTVTPQPGGSSMDHSEAVAYCTGLVLGGRTDWRLPTIYELISLARGCNGVTGNPGIASLNSTCRINTSDGNPYDCSACPQDQGPTSGCYSAGFDACQTREFLSDTVSTGGIGGYYYFDYFGATVGMTPYSADVLCIVDL